MPTERSEGELHTYFYDIKKQRKYCKVWLAIDRQRNQVIAYQISKEKDKIKDNDKDNRYDTNADENIVSSD